MNIHLDLEKELEKLSFEDIEKNIIVPFEDAIRLLRLSKLQGILFQLNSQYITNPQSNILRAIDSIEFELKKLLGLNTKNNNVVHLNDKGYVLHISNNNENKEPKKIDKYESAKNHLGHPASRAYVENTALEADIDIIEDTNRKVTVKKVWGKAEETISNYILSLDKNKIHSKQDVLRVLSNYSSASLSKTIKSLVSKGILKYNQNNIIFSDGEVDENAIDGSMRGRTLEFIEDNILKLDRTKQYVKKRNKKKIKC